MNHANHSNSVSTLYISFTSSPDAAVELANRRMRRRRGDQHLAVVDPGYRLLRGHPILDIAKEAERYGILGLYRENYFLDHYLCLWEVTPDEVIGIWRLDDLRKHDNWYKNIVMPAFEKHNKR